jgi:ribonuclease Z
MDIALTFLGTSNAIPTSLRNHPAILLQWNNETILFDCGEGTQRQFKHAKINPCKLTRIFLTHLHGDHALGLPGLLETLEMSEYSKTLKIYGPEGTRRHLQLLQQIYGKFNIKHEVYEMPTEVDEKEFAIENSPMDHNISTYAYSFIIKDKFRLQKAKIKKLKLPNSPILGDLQKGKDIVWDGKKIKAKDVTYEEKGKKVAIVMDTKMNNNAVKLAQDADILICESTYAEREKDYAEKYKHLTASQAATIAKKAKAKQLILTHIAQRYEHNLKEIEKEAKKVFKSTKIVKDLDTAKL